jgi:hypothetical protein
MVVFVEAHGWDGRQIDIPSVVRTRSYEIPNHRGEG